MYGAMVARRFRSETQFEAANRVLSIFIKNILYNEILLGGCKMNRLTWINESITNGEHNNLMHNAYYAIDVISRSLRRANALEALKQIHDVGEITEECYKKALVDILKDEGFELTES